ncbi:hypothetical protein [Streptomyces sp. NPDC048419]|uniref:hypothetical protein n=1 Tax=Streptomyces sp. NPDC048419 TaxID=3365547 RepID=UPI00370F98D4
MSTVTGAVIGVGATSLSDRSRWRREQSERRTAVKRELYAAYLAAVARTWSEIRAVVLDGTEPWPERAHRAGEAYRNGRVYELRYQISITAPADIVALSDQVMRGIRDLVEELAAGETFSDWADLRSANLGWFDAFDILRGRMRLDLAAA